MGCTSSIPDSSSFCDENKDTNHKSPNNKSNAHDGITGNPNHPIPSNYNDITVNKTVGRRRQAAIDNELRLNSQGIKAPSVGRKIGVVARSESLEVRGRPTTPIEWKLSPTVVAGSYLAGPSVTAKATTPFVPSPLAYSGSYYSYYSTNSMVQAGRQQPLASRSASYYSYSSSDESFRTMLKRSEQQKSTSGSSYVYNTDVFDARIVASVASAKEFNDSPDNIFLMDRKRMLC